MQGHHDMAFAKSGTYLARKKGGPERWGERIRSAWMAKSRLPGYSSAVGVDILESWENWNEAWKEWSSPDRQDAPAVPDVSPEDLGNVMELLKRAASVLEEEHGYVCHNDGMGEGWPCVINGDCG